MKPQLGLTMHHCVHKKRRSAHDDLRQEQHCTVSETRGGNYPEDTISKDPYLGDAFASLEDLQRI